MTDGTRREFLIALGATFLSFRLTVQQSDSQTVGRVYDPQRAGRPKEPITALDTDAGIQAIEKKLRCSCGCGLDIYTCRTTDFQCTYSPALHKDVLRLAGQGKTAQQILDEFVKQYGQVALMSPPREGFNLAGYFLPGVDPCRRCLPAADAPSLDAGCEGGRSGGSCTAVECHTGRTRAPAPRARPAPRLSRVPRCSS